MSDEVSRECAAVELSCLLGITKNNNCCDFCTCTLDSCRSQVGLYDESGMESYDDLDTHFFDGK